jgi:hypothetical protein
MNWYAIMLFMLFSPIGWIICGVLLAIFIFANLKFNMAVNVSRRILQPIDPDDPHPADTMAFMRKHLEDSGINRNKRFWFTILATSGIALIVVLGFPMLCTFTSFTTYCP